jgi:hypothetical protein
MAYHPTDTRLERRWCPFCEKYVRNYWNWCPICGGDTSALQGLANATEPVVLLILNVGEDHALEESQADA